jgi:hypothetical protein
MGGWNRAERKKRNRVRQFRANGRFLQDSGTPCRYFERMVGFRKDSGTPCRYFL